MAIPAQSYQTVRRTDSQLVREVARVAKEIGAQKITITPLLGSKSRGVSVEAIDDEGWLQEIFKTKSCVLYQIATEPRTPGILVTREEKEPTDRVNVNFGNDDNDQQALNLVISAHQRLPGFGSEDVREFLGDNIESFYRAREEKLLRLEDLSQRLIEENSSYRKQLDDEARVRQEQLEGRLLSREKELGDEFERKDEELEKRRLALEQREKDLDDSSSRDARRKDRQILKRELASRSESFSLTRETVKKRLLIHGVFIGLLSLIITFVFYNTTKSLPQGNEFSAAWWIQFARTVLGIAAAGATAVFYIRWNDQWFRSHADEEFRLRRLELDIDRASWVVELAMEWKEAKDEEIPEVLFSQLTRNLFQESTTELVRHPSEDLVEAISGLKLQVPGVGEATVTPRGMRKFKKARGEASDGK